MPSSDQPTSPTPSGIPTPPSGVGASDLATTSTDPDELRKLLDRARERLSFYESFDRIIGENIRRSGELMVETVALREQAHLQAAEFAQERADFDATRQQDRESYRTLVQSALTEVATTKISIESVMARLEGVLASWSDAPTEDPVPETIAVQTVSTTSALVEPWATDPDAVPATPTPDSPGEATGTETTASSPAGTGTEAGSEEEGPTRIAGPRSVEILVQNVPNAGMALSLQKYLRELDPVTTVDTREFAAGVLRLHVEATAALTETVLATWLAENSAALRSTSPTAIEIDITRAG